MGFPLDPPRPFPPGWLRDSNDEIHSPDGTSYISGNGHKDSKGRSRWEVWFGGVHDSTHFRREDARIQIRKLKSHARPEVCPHCRESLKSVLPPSGIYKSCYWCGRSLTQARPTPPKFQIA